MRAHRTRMAVVVAALVLLSSAPAWAWDPFETTHGDVDDGNALLQAGKPSEAVTAYEAARQDIPEQPELHYDIGLAQLALVNHRAAVNALERALERVEGPFKTDVLFALGTAHAYWAIHLEAAPDESGEETALDHWEKAAHFLERTLRRAPAHEGALRNLELALMRVDPPCSAREDEYEPNDSAGEATPAPFPEGQNELDVPLKLCAEDADWFSVTMQAGDRLFAEVTTETGGAKLGLSLRTPDGATQLRPPEGDTEPITKLAFQEGTAEGEMRLRVANLADEEADYRLKLRLLPSCARLEDGFEDNDAPGAAHTVTKNDAEKLGQLRLCPQDDDWFRVGVGAGDSLVVIAQFQLEKGTPSLAIADATGQVLAERSLSEEDAKKAKAGGQGGTPLILTLLEPPPGVYLVRVSGTLDVETAYGLQMQVVPPCPDGDDGMEENDTREAAKPLQGGGQGAPPGGAPGGGGQGGPQLLRVCAGDEDWFQVTATKDQPQVVTVTFDHARGDLDLALYDASSAAPVAESANSSDEVGGEGLALPTVAEDTPYYVRVRAAEGTGSDESNFYLLQVQSPKPNQDGDKGEDEQDPEEKKDEEQPEDEQGEEPPPEEKPEQPEEKKPEPRERMEDEMDQLDRNPRNLEAERARSRSPFRHARPTRPW